MSAIQTKSLSILYETDETAWLEAMARLVRRRRCDELDYENLAEFLADMARRDRREMESRLITLIAHLLTWQHQPDKRTRSWLVTIERERMELLADLQSRTLRNHAETILAAAYTKARRLAVVETGLKRQTFPAECAYSLAEVLRELPAADLPAD